MALDRLGAVPVVQGPCTVPVQALDGPNRVYNEEPRPFGPGLLPSGMLLGYGPLWAAWDWSCTGLASTGPVLYGPLGRTVGSGPGLAQAWPIMAHNGPLWASTGSGLYGPKGRTRGSGPGLAQYCTGLAQTGPDRLRAQNSPFLDHFLGPKPWI